MFGSFAQPAHRLLGSIALGRKAAPLRVTANNWFSGEVRNWYQELGSTAINKLELRKELEGVKHEFVVIYLEGELIYRIDRRALGGPSAEAVAWGCEAEDAIALVSAEDCIPLYQETDAEVVLEFNARKPDLYDVLAICIAVQRNPQLKQYNLHHYNCYFHARSITSIVTRYCLLQHSDMLCTMSEGVRWDIATPPGLSEEEKASTDWSILKTTVNTAATEAIEQSLWPILKSHTSTYEIEEEQLRRILSAAIQDAVTKIISASIGNDLLYSLYEEVLRVAKFTLWRDTLSQNLSEYKHKGSCEVVAGIILSSLLSAHGNKDGLLEDVGSRVQDALMSPTLSPTSPTLSPTSPTEPSSEPVAQGPLQVRAPKDLVRMMSVTTRTLSRHISTAQKILHESPTMAPGTLLNKAIGQVANASPSMVRKVIKQLIPPEQLRDQINYALASWKLKDDIAECILNHLLLKSEGNIPESMIRISVGKKAEQLVTHAGLQEHILRMTRTHTKMVALVVVGVQADSMFNELRQKMEDIWKEVQPQSVTPSRAKEAYTRITTAVKDSINAMVGHDCKFHIHRRTKE